MTHAADSVLHGKPSIGKVIGSGNGRGGADGDAQIRDTLSGAASRDDANAFRRLGRVIVARSTIWRCTGARGLRVANVVAVLAPTPCGRSASAR